jgi:ATP-dependent RNA helicase RhlE
MSKAFNQLGLQAEILKSVSDRGYTTPTPIQQEAIPPVLAGRDVLGLAQTGTGKTAAFLLPILQRLMTGPRRRTRALIVAPTRELAEQIRQEAAIFSRSLNLRSAVVYGGVGKNPQVEALRRGTEIIVACPGRLLDLIGDGAADLRSVEVLVLDEADRMCDMGFLPDVRRILKHLPAQRQTLFFSATMPDDARKLADTILKDPVTVQIGVTAPAETVSHAIYPVAQKQKKELLVNWLETTATGRVLIFTRTKHRARNLARDLERQGYRVAALQGNMSQNARQRAIDGFRSGKHDFLVATDVAARGIDVEDISHVVNFDMPDTVDAYTHRIGRTGRAEQSGEAITFYSADDTDMLRQIETTLGSRIERRRLAEFNYQELPSDPPAMPGRSTAARSRRDTNQRPARRSSSRRRSGRPPQEQARRQSTSR